MVECMMPALAAGRVTVQVSNNGVDYSQAQLDGKAMFEYREGVRAIRLAPSIGPVQGGTEVLLQRSWAVERGSVVCSVGKQ